MKKLTQAVSAAALLCQMSNKKEKEADPILALLKAVAEYGSINKAAKAVGLSYKGAWERIETINNLSLTPLVNRQTGGSGGGGTILTKEGESFVERASIFSSELQKFVTFFQDTPEEAYAMLRTLGGMKMKLSARNVWLGNVTHIEQGTVNSVVTISLKGEDIIVSTITHNSVQRLSLEVGKEVYAIVKAPSVMLSSDVDPAKISARNVFKGTINRIAAGAVNDEVIIDIADGNTVTSILTSASVQSLGLEAGKKVSAIIKASSVVLAIP